MKEINGIKIDEDNLVPLHDCTRKGEAVTYFYGAVAEIAMAGTAPEINDIWQSARRHLGGLYRFSEQGEEDLHVLEMELARVVRRRAEKINGPAAKKLKLPALTEDEKNEFDQLHDRSRIIPARRTLRMKIKEFRFARTEEEMESVYESAVNRLQAIYGESEHNERDLSVCMLLLAHRYRQAVVKFLEKRNGLGG